MQIPHEFLEGRVQETGLRFARAGPLRRRNGLPAAGCGFRSAGAKRSSKRGRRAPARKCSAGATFRPNNSPIGDSARKPSSRSSAGLRRARPVSSRPIDEFERKLYLIRKRAENATHRIGHNYFYVEFVGKHA